MISAIVAVVVFGLVISVVIVSSPASRGRRPPTSRSRTSWRGTASTSRRCGRCRVRSCATASTSASTSRRRRSRTRVVTSCATSRRTSRSRSHRRDRPRGGPDPRHAARRRGRAQRRRAHEAQRVVGGHRLPAGGRTRRKPCEHDPRDGRRPCCSPAARVDASARPRPNCSVDGERLADRGARACSLDVCDPRDRGRARARRRSARGARSAGRVRVRSPRWPRAATRSAAARRRRSSVRRARRRPSVRSTSRCSSCLRDFDAGGCRRARASTASRSRCARAIRQPRSRVARDPLSRRIDASMHALLDAIDVTWVDETDWGRSRPPRRSPTSTPPKTRGEVGLEGPR